MCGDVLLEVGVGGAEGGEDVPFEGVALHLV